MADLDTICRSRERSDVMTGIKGLLDRFQADTLAGSNYEKFRHQLCDLLAFGDN